MLREGALRDGWVWPSVDVTPVPSRIGAQTARFDLPSCAGRGHSFTYAEHSSLRCTIGATQPAALFCRGKDPEL